jgi:predicted phosphodiesterase
MRTNQSSKLVIEALHKFPKSSKNSIAEMLFENYPLVFNSKEHARSIIKNYTTPTGRVINKLERGSDTTFKAIMDRYKSKCEKRRFYKISNEFNNILWISDIHFPNQDNEAVGLALDYGKKNKINCIVLGGDILDNEPFTNHDAPPPSKYDVVDWFEMVEEFISMLRIKFPKSKIIWLEGNHDNWYKRYLMKKAPILFDDEYYDLTNRLNLKKYNIEFLPQNVIALAGKLQMTHGQHLVKGIIAPVNAARGLFLKTKSNSIIGHVHQNSFHLERTLKGDTIGCWSVGCLCTLSPLYDPFNTKHSQGFAHIKFEKNGNFNVQLKEIYQGKIL